MWTDDSRLLSPAPGGGVSGGGGDDGRYCQTLPPLQHLVSKAENGISRVLMRVFLGSRH